jgi:hypothetical protein
MAHSHGLILTWNSDLSRQTHTVVHRSRFCLTRPAYALTGSEAITVSEAAKVIADVTGKPVKHNDIDRDVWIQGSVAAGVPAEYGEVLRMLTETIASGMGSRPNDNVKKVTGVPPIKFADFARRTAQAWT